MNFDQNLDLVVRNFTSNFNQMCRGTNRDYLIRTNNPNAESPQEKTYTVEYKMQYTGIGWEVYAEWRKWFIFSKKFPFVQIDEIGNDKLKLSGLFTENMPTVNRNPAELQQLLNDYLIHCRNLPGQSFIRV